MLRLQLTEKIPATRGCEKKKTWEPPSSFSLASHTLPPSLPQGEKFWGLRIVVFGEKGILEERMGGSP
jgi:hypothetical protein